MKKKLLKKPKLSEAEMKEFENNVKVNMKRAYFSALGILGSRESALELSQEAFIRAYRNYDKFDPSKNFFTWYYKILKNLCLNYIRDSKKHTSTSFLDSIELIAAGDNPQQDLEESELHNQVETALMKLDKDDREILMLKEFQGFSYKEIADFLDLPNGTVMSRLYYARKKLANNLKGVI